MQNTDEIGADIADGRHRLDIGFIGQKPAESDAEKLMSLGDIQLQPLFIFERRRLAGNRPIRSFSSLRGMKIVLPPARSLTSRTVASVFALSGIDGRNTRIDYLPIDEGIARLQRGEFDAGLFILGADSDLMAGLARNPDLVMVETTQLTAVTKRLDFLKEVKLPAGVFDLAHDVPDRDVGMLASTISVVARRGLPPATVYAVLEAMRQVHRGSSYVNRADEFPRYSGSGERDDSAVDDFYRNGTPWVYAHLPIGLASVIDAYLAPLLALWIAASALNVIAEAEKVRLLAMVALARIALWWARRRIRNGVALSGMALTVIRKIESGIAHRDHGIQGLLAELRETTGA